MAKHVTGYNDAAKAGYPSRVSMDAENKRNAANVHAAAVF